MNIMILSGRKALKNIYLEVKRCISITHSNNCELNKSCFNLLKAKIKFSGPITAYDYMKEVLTNPKSGYYISKDVFGKSGDFTTSPEISQLFGEVLALWTINEWNKLGSPKPLQLVELGPGRGSMMEDILRVYKQLKLSSDISIHLVEISDELSKLQGNKLCTSYDRCENKAYFQEGRTPNNVPVYWHRTIQDVPSSFTCFLAHEFFDALPVHILQKTKDGWREVLIDLSDCGNKLHYVVSRSATPACFYSKFSNGRDYFEISPQAGVIMEHIGLRLEEYGGFALIVDYGHSGEGKDTFRGFRNHQLVDPLEHPGTSDLTADVDFSFLKNSVQDKLISFGPVTQQHFLKNLHIDVRLQMILKGCTNEEKRKDLLSGYHMITDSDKMGERFKVLSFFPAILKEYLNKFPVAGF